MSHSEDNKIRHVPSCAIFVFVFACIIGAQNTVGSSEQIMSEADALQNVSRTIENLLEGYDIRLRPQFGGKLNL